MVRRQQRWILVADPIEGVPEELLKLAFLLEHIADELASSQWTVQQLRREIDLRQAPILRRLNKLATRSAAPSPADSPGSEP